MQDFKQLKVWEKSHQLTLAVYDVSERFPRREIFGLTSQIRRAASSIPANIAEGCGKRSSLELARYLDIALGSSNELEYHFILARDLHYLPQEHFNTLTVQLVEVRRMLTAFWQKVYDQAHSR